MLLDALKAERYRLWRDRGAVFWGFLFPGVLLFFGGVLITVVTSMFKDRLPPGHMNVALEATQGLYWANAFVFQLFVLIGAAAMFASDYRWETWRLQTPRNSRMNLILGKLIVFAVAVLVVLAGMLIGNVAGAFVRALVLHQSLTPFGQGVTELTFLRAVLAGWLELMVVGCGAALLAILTRSNVAALLLPVLFTGAQAFGLGIARINVATADVKSALLFPNLAAQLVRGGSEAPGVDPAMAWWGFAGLVIWILVLSGGTLLLFQRQELSRE